MDQMKVHNVIRGPYDDGEDIWNVCLVEVDGELQDVELFFDTFDDAYEMVAYFTKSIDPVILFVDEDEGYYGVANEQ